MEDQHEAPSFASPAGKEQDSFVDTRQNRIFPLTTVSDFSSLNHRSKSQATIREQIPTLLSKPPKNTASMLLDEDLTGRKTISTAMSSKPKTTQKTPNRLRIMDFSDNTKRSNFDGVLNEINILNLSPIEQTSSVAQSPSFRSPSSNLKNLELINGSAFTSPKYLENKQKSSLEGNRLGRNSHINFLGRTRGSSTNDSYDQGKNRSIKIESPDNNESWLAMMEKQRIDLQQFRDEERQKRKLQDPDRTVHKMQAESNSVHQAEKQVDGSITSPPTKQKLNSTKGDLNDTKPGLCLSFADDSSSELQVSMFPAHHERNNIQSKELTNQVLGEGRKTTSFNQFKLAHIPNITQNLGTSHALESSFDDSKTSTNLKKSFFGKSNLGSGSTYVNEPELNEKVDALKKDIMVSRKSFVEQFQALNERIQQRTSVVSNDSGPSTTDHPTYTKVSIDNLLMNSRSIKQPNRSISNTRSSHNDTNSYIPEDDDCSLRLRTASFNPEKTRTSTNENEHENSKPTFPQPSKIFQGLVLGDAGDRLSNKSIISHLRPDHNDSRSKSNPRPEIDNYRTLLPTKSDTSSMLSQNYKKSGLPPKHQIIGERPVSIDFTSVRSPKTLENLRANQNFDEKPTNINKNQDSQSSLSRVYSTLSASLGGQNSKKDGLEVSKTENKERPHLPDYLKNPKEYENKPSKLLKNNKLEETISTAPSSDAKNQNLKDKYTSLAKNSGSDYKFLISNSQNETKAEAKEGSYFSKQQWYKEKSSKHILQEPSQNIKKIEEILKRFRQQIN